MKNNKVDKQIESNAKQLFLLKRIKALITDIFMIYMPILYITTYGILGSKEAFQANQLVILICFLLYACITSLLFALKSQTLGYIYAEIRLVRDDGKKVSFFVALFRFFAFCFSMSLLFGLFIPFMNKNRRTFHDFVAKTNIIECKNKNN